MGKNRSPIEALVLEKSLALMAVGRNSDIIDYAIQTDQAENLPIKNVCAKVSTALSDDIDSVCGLLGISKRRFLEAAFVEALALAHDIIEAEGVHDYLAERGDEIESTLVQVK
jgi:hypothetical protein